MNGKLIYGNLLKVNDAIYKSQFAFTAPANRRIIKNIGITEAEPVEAFYLIGSKTESEGLYGIIDEDNDQDEFKYLWSIEAGNAYIASNPTYPTVIVKTISGTENETFTLQCMIVDDLMAYANISKDYTHIKTQKNPINITGITTDYNNSCTFENPLKYTCTSTSKHTVATASSTGDVRYRWRVYEGAVIESGQGTDSIVISNTGRDISKTITIECTVSDLLGEAIDTIQVTHTKTMRSSVDAIGITENYNNSCTIGEDGCIATSSYSFTYSNAGLPINIVWSLWSSTDNITDVKILSGQGSGSIVVESNSSKEEINFNVRAMLKDEYTSDYIDFPTSHTRTEPQEIVITSLTETITGSCKYPLGGSCQVNSEYTINASGYDILVWEVTGEGATIVSGQGTTTIVVTTPDGSSTASYNVKCTASNIKYSDSINKDYSQLKSVRDIVITSLTETAAGSCEYPAGNTCEIITEYTIL
jgi:hypothetical protein